MRDYIEREAAQSAVWEEDNQTDMILAIGSLPAADVAPVRHGRWIHPHWRNSVSAADCSECGAEAQHIEYRGVQKHYKICPSCGARMDKEDVHEAD